MRVIVFEDNGNVLVFSSLKKMYKYVPMTKVHSNAIDYALRDGGTTYFCKSFKLKRHLIL